jgi:hypothetical protein
MNEQTRLHTQTLDRIYKKLLHFYGVTGVPQEYPAHGTLGELVWTSMTDGEWFGPEQKFWNVRVDDKGRTFRDQVKTRNGRRPFHNIHASTQGESPPFDRLIDMVFKPPFGIQQAYIIPYHLVKTHVSRQEKGYHLYVSDDLIAEPEVQDITDRVQAHLIDWVRRVD